MLTEIAHDAQEYRDKAGHQASTPMLFAHCKTFWGPVMSQNYMMLAEGKIMWRHTGLITRCWQLNCSLPPAGYMSVPPACFKYTSNAVSRSMPQCRADAREVDSSHKILDVEFWNGANKSDRIDNLLRMKTDFFKRRPAMCVQSTKF